MTFLPSTKRPGSTSKGKYYRLLRAAGTAVCRPVIGDLTFVEIVSGHFGSIDIHDTAIVPLESHLEFGDVARLRNRDLLPEVSRDVLLGRVPAEIDLRCLISISVAERSLAARPRSASS